MKRRAVCLRWTIGILATAAILTVAALLALPPYLNRPETRRKIETLLSRRLGGAVTFAQIRVGLIPQPVLSFDHLNLSIPKTVTGTFPSVSLYPRMTSFLHGDLAFSRLRVHAPVLTVALSRKPPGRKRGIGPSLREGSAVVRQTLASFGPGMVIEWDHGTAVVADRGTTVLALRGVNARIEVGPDLLSVDLDGSAEPGGRFGVKGRFAFGAQHVQARELSLRVGQSRAAGLSARIDWGNGQRVAVTEGRAALALDELFRWTSASSFAGFLPQELRAIRGSAELDSISGGGPLASPNEWTGTVRGRLRDAVIESGLLPAALFLQGTFTVDRRSLSMAGLSASLGRSALVDTAFTFRWKDQGFLVSSGRGSLSLDDLSRWRSRLGSLVPRAAGALSGTVQLDSLRLSGAFPAPRAWKIDARGTIDGVAIEWQGLPGVLQLQRGRFAVAADAWSFSQVRAVLRDSSLVLSGSVRTPAGTVDRASVTAAGSIGGETEEWLYAAGAVSPAWRVRAPVVVDRLRIDWQRDGELAVAAHARIAGDASVGVDLIRTSESLDLKRLAVADADSSAEINGGYFSRGIVLSFSGNLGQTTLHKIFPSQPQGEGMLAGNLRVDVPADPQKQGEALGSIRISNLTVPWDRPVPLTIEALSLKADGSFMVFRDTAVRVGSSSFRGSGSLAVSGGDVIVDGEVSSDRIELSELLRALSGSAPSAAAGRGRTGESAERSFAGSGFVRVSARELLYAGYRFDDVRSQTAFGPGRVNAAFTQAKICGLAVTGTFAVDQQGRQLEVQAASAGGDVGGTLDCLSQERVRMNGTFDLQAELGSRYEGAELLPELKGRIVYSARDGKIYRYPFLAKILSVLSVTELLRGKIPEFGGSGFSYHTMAVTATVERGRLKLEKAVIDGSSLTIIAEGEVDLVAGKADLIVLVAPFSTLNWIIRHIPLVGRLLGGTLVSIPAKVTGDLADPDVVFLSPSAVGSRIVTLLENVLKLPVEILSPLLPKTEKEPK